MDVIMSYKCYCSLFLLKMVCSDMLNTIYLRNIGCQYRLNIFILKF